MTNKKVYWEKEKFIEIVNNSKTITEILKYFGLPYNQGGYNRIFHKYVKEHNINIDHLLRFNKNRVFMKKIPIEELLISGKFRDTSSLKLRLIKENLLTNKCYECGMDSVWNNKLLVLHLDHIDGDNTNNLLVNLRLLCPNCHSQTDTYCGSNKKKQKNIHKYICTLCKGPKKTIDSDFCATCVKITKSGKTKIDWPEPDFVLNQVEQKGYSQVAKELGISNTAVKKFLKRNNLKLDN